MLSMSGGEPARKLALAQLVNSVGDGAFYVTSVLYFSRVVDLIPTQIGLGLTVGWMTGFVATMPLGHLGDRYGLRGTAVLLGLGTATAITIFLLVGSFVQFMLAMCLYAMCQSGLSAVRQALLARLVDPHERTRVRARLQSALNAGLAVGATIGGLTVSVDEPAAYLAVFVLDAVGFAGAAWLLWRLPPPCVVSSPTRAGQRPRVHQDRPYLVAAALNEVTLLYRPLLSLVLPLWIVGHTVAPGAMVAILFVLNTVAVVVFQVSVARRVVDPASAARAMRIGGRVMFSACAFFALSTAVDTPGPAIILLVAGAVLQVFAEMTLASGAWEIGFGLAPIDRHGQYQGAFDAGVPVARAVGPMLLTALVLTGSTWGWLVLGGLFLLAGSAMTPTVRWAQRTRPPLVPLHLSVSGPRK